jgi:CDP-diacylglycerol--glycerol-3-phosphate 3-phosphatidyltransferase
MTSLDDLKRRFQELLRPAAASLATRGVTANQVTIAAIVMSAATGLLLALFAESRWPLVLLALVMFARLALNAIDGLIAREHGQASHSGALLNEIGDAASDLALTLPLLLVPGFSPLLVALAITMGVVAETAGLAALGIGAARRYDGPMGKSDRAIAFGLLALLHGLEILPAVLVNLGLAVMVGLGFLTIMNRVSGALAEAGKSK